MGRRDPQDQGLLDRRIKNHLNVLKYSLENVGKQGTGGLESPSKLTFMFAGYTAMRALLQIKTRNWADPTGDAVLDSIAIGDAAKKARKEDKENFLFRVDKEVSHPVGRETKPLLRVTTFRYWSRRVLALFGEG